jgi:hypothetical protein
VNIELTDEEDWGNRTLCVYIVRQTSILSGHSMLYLSLYSSPFKSSIVLPFRVLWGFSAALQRARIDVG